MAQQVLRRERLDLKLSTRELMLVAVLAAMLVGDGYGSSLVRNLTRNTDTFFLMSAFFTVLAVTTRRRWMATFLSVITGLIFLAIPGAPIPIHIIAAPIANGLTFDLTLLGLTRRSLSPEPSRSQLVTAGTVASGVMAATILPLVNLFSPSAIPLYILPAIVLADAFVGLLGVRFGYLVVKRLQMNSFKIRGRSIY